MTMPTFPSASTAASYAKDLAERVVTTFLGAFLSVVTVSTPFDLAMWKAASIAGIAAAYALVKGVVAKTRGDKQSASLAKGV